MKTKNLFLVTVVALFAAVVESSGQSNTVLGVTNPTPGQENIIIGNQAGISMQNTPTVFGNIFMGARAGRLNTIGKQNVFLGYQSAMNNTEGIKNTFVGTSSGGGITIGNNNSALGYGAGVNSGSGSDNVSLGYFSGIANGSNNTCVGTQSGYNFGTGSGNVFLGYKSGSIVSLFGKSNILVIDNGFNNYPLIYGEFDNKKIKFNVFDNLTTPFTSFVEVAGKTYESGLRFTNLPSTLHSSKLVAPNGRVLTVNAQGDVVLTTDQGSGGSTLIQAGTNVTVTGTGVIGNPFIINSTATNCNLYSCDGTLNTLPTNPDNPNPGLRTVTMANNNLFFQTNPAFDGNGRVYIGASTNNFTPITATSRYRLFVEGGILTERVKVATNGTVNWADYVFADDYKLATLSDVEKFIKKNNHLPGIESAETLSKEGLDLGDMQAKQMAKIEELTLYVIQQNKEIEELKAQVKTLLERK